MPIDAIYEAIRATPHPHESLVNMAEFWSALVSGRTRIVDSGATDDYHYLEVASVEIPAHMAGLDARRVRMLERVLVGDPLKAIAPETGCAMSTVAIAVGSCLRAMGLDQRSRRVPFLLVLMLHALRDHALLPIRIQSAKGQREGRQLVCSARFEQGLSPRLTAAELAVVRLLVEGRTQEDIAKQRGRCVRTIANQIANIYRKLRICGRIELIRSLITNSALPRPNAGFGAAGCSP